jgi:transposase
MKVTRVGIDLAKNVFQIHGVDPQEKKALHRKLRRNEMLGFFKELPGCLIGMEACATSHYWARKLSELGHTVKLIAPQFVKPYVKGNKNDANDAEAICEAVGRPHMRFVTIKTVEQQDLQALHRIRSELVHQRTAKANQIRGLLGEYGIAVGKGIAVLRKALPEILEDAENGLTGNFRALLSGLREDLVALDERVTTQDRTLHQIAHTHPDARRLLKLRGVGPVGATGMVASMGDGKGFTCGRGAAAWVGLVPRQHSSGGKEKLLGISKRGDAYLRTVLIHGARSVVKTCKDKDDSLSRWVQGLCARRNKNVAAVALANKTMRMAWAILNSGADYQPDYHQRTQTTA